MKSRADFHSVDMSLQVLDLEFLEDATFRAVFYGAGLK